MFKINEVYKAILAFAGAYPDAEGYIFQHMLGNKTPMVVKELPVVLPLQQHLQNPDGKIRFHPLAESAIRGESEVTEKFRKWVNLKFNFTIGVIGQSLLNLVASPELHPQLTPEQTEIMLKISKADTTAVTNFSKLMTAGLKANADSVYVNIYLRRGGDYKGKKAHCAGVTAFPFYAKLLKEEFKNIRESDKKTFKEIMEFIFPGIDTEEEYNYGSYSSVAKYMDALMMTAGKIAGRLNEIIHLYKDYIDEAESLVFDEAWIPYFENVDNLLNDIRQIPIQTGNEGSDLNAESPVQTIQTVNQPQVGIQQLQPAVQQVQQQPQSVVNASGKVSLAQIRAANPMGVTGLNPFQQVGFGVGNMQQLNPNMPNPNWNFGPSQQQLQQQPQAMLQQGQVVLTPGAIVQGPAGPCVVSANGQLIPVNQGQLQMGFQQPMQQQNVGWGDLRGRLKV